MFFPLQEVCSGTENQRHRSFTQKLLHKQTLLQGETFTQRNFYAQKMLRTEVFTKKTFTQGFLHTNARTHRSFYKAFCAQKLKLVRAEAFKRRSFYTEKLFDRGTLEDYTGKKPQTERVCMCVWIPFEIDPKGSGPPFCSYNTRGLEKNIQNDWVPMNFSPYKMVGPCASTTSFLYLTRMFDFYLFLNMNFACMLGPCAPKKASFCKNMFLYHFPSFFSMVIKGQPILFVRKWAQRCVRPVFSQC